MDTQSCCFSFVIDDMETWLGVLDFYDVHLNYVLLWVQLFAICYYFLVFDWLFLFPL